MIDPTKDLSLSTPLSSVPPERVNRNTRVEAVNQTEKSETRFTIDPSQQEEKRILQQLRARDREVRAHEAAHVAAGREFIRSGPDYILQQGPDGRAYAVGGEVRLDTRPVTGNPEETLRKAEVVRRAALAPAEPSSQDVQVAAQAQAMAARARLDLAVLRREEIQVEPAPVSREPASPLSAFESPVDSPSLINQYA